MKMLGTQTAPVVVGLPNPDVFFRKTELEAEDKLFSQCGGWGNHWWHPAMWALGPAGHAGNCAHVLRIPLLSSQGNKVVHAVAGVGTPVRTVEMRGWATPPSAVA